MRPLSQGLRGRPGSRELGLGAVGGAVADRPCSREVFRWLTWILGEEVVCTSPCGGPLTVVPSRAEGGESTPACFKRGEVLLSS